MNAEDAAFHRRRRAKFVRLAELIFASEGRVKPGLRRKAAELLIECRSVTPTMRRMALAILNPANSSDERAAAISDFYERFKY